ncbi:MAG: hypothetical protein DWQ19_09555 [Crenarchaeota archaeon]|nr:MAG: hypothetical protein DWQ19_09555 [Thermoproteota archaeon]
MINLIQKFFGVFGLYENPFFGKTNNKEADKIFKEYIICVKDYLLLGANDQVVQNEPFMRDIEERIGIFDCHVDHFRRNLMAFMGGLAASKKKLRWDSHPNLAKAIKLKIKNSVEEQPDSEHANLNSKILSGLAGWSDLERWDYLKSSKKEEPEVLRPGLKTESPTVEYNKLISRIITGTATKDEVVRANELREEIEKKRKIRIKKK